MSPEGTLNRLLTERRLTLAVAESCTGGLISRRITDAAGASAYFLAGLVTYSNEAKEKLLSVPGDVIAAHGAVSAEVAGRMAEGARRATGADIGLSVTGIAGPGGGTDQKPVGTVYMGLAAVGAGLVRHFKFDGERPAVKRQAADEALRFVLDYLEGEGVFMRAFLALPIPADVAAYLREAIGRLERRTEGVRWVRDEGIHITMKFLGEIDEDMAERMKEALSPIGASFKPFCARLGGLDAFPSSMRARVIVVKLKEGVEQSQAIFKEVEERLAALDVEREKRSLTPHITLGRRRSPKPFPNGDPLPIEEREFLIEQLVLYKSTLTPGGAIYAPVWKIKLGGEDR